ncbi:MAG TPA: hypothetical protein VFT19_13930 [Solirubrobacterales bacterium]|nr:hypothetical protein [Solirubrobacterales bacterium]
MNWLKKGPELKLPKLRKPSLGGAGKTSQIKAPAFATDLYQDLRDRRLLLPLALVLVAIAAVPFLLGDSETEVPPPVTGTVGAADGGNSRAGRLAVVEATPGLRDYKKRLGDRTESDPFKQQHTGVPKSAQLESTGSSGGGSSEETLTVDETSSGSVDVEVQPGDRGSGGSGGGGAAPRGSGVRLIEFRFNIQISHTEEAADGSRKWTEPQVRRGVKALTQLPGKKVPVATVAGVNLHNGRAFFLVSDDVKSLEGDFSCKTRTPDGLCELLEIETGFPLELVYGPTDARYRIKVIKIDAVWAGRPGDGRSNSTVRAAFGGPAAKSLPRGSGSVSKFAQPQVISR